MSIPPDPARHPPLLAQLPNVAVTASVRRVADGRGAVTLPDALGRKYPRAAWAVGAVAWAGPYSGTSMASGSVDLSLLVREVIQAARAAGLGEAADELEARTSAAYATSSEWLGEVGLAIQHFLSRERGHVPVALERRLYEGLAEVRKVWPDLG